MPKLTKSSNNYETVTFVEQKVIDEEIRAIRYSFGTLEIRKNPKVRFGYFLTLYYSNEDDFARVEFNNDFISSVYFYMLMSGIDEAALSALKMYQYNVKHHLDDLYKCFEENDITALI